MRVEAGLIDHVGAVCAEVAPAFTCAIVTDDHIAPHWLARVERSFERLPGGPRVVSHTIAPGEAWKTRATWSEVTDWMLAEGCGRDTTVIALGGGVVCDLAGFVAATFLRGVPVVHVPTSLLAMVDAAIGGKTGVDTAAGKNLVGAFHHPAAVLADPAVLSTLPVRERRAGIAEMLKHGAIDDLVHFAAVSRWGASEPTDWTDPAIAELIAASVRVKARIVSEDPRESGRRQVLNAGHTVAHALERVLDYRILHGEAVAIGLVAEAAIGERLGVTAAGAAGALREALGAAGLPVSMPAGVEAPSLIEAMGVDKKRRGGKLAFALLAGIGRVAGDADRGWTTFVDEATIRAGMATTLHGFGAPTAAG